MILTSAVVAIFGIGFTCFIFWMFLFFVWREVRMSCIVALVLLWCIHANAREVADLLKKLRVHQRVLLVELVAFGVCIFSASENVDQSC